MPLSYNASTFIVLTQLRTIGAASSHLVYLPLHCLPLHSFKSAQTLLQSALNDEVDAAVRRFEKLLRQTANNVNSNHGLCAGAVCLRLSLRVSHDVLRSCCLQRQMCALWACACACARRNLWRGRVKLRDSDICGHARLTHILFRFPSGEEIVSDEDIVAAMAEVCAVRELAVHLVLLIFPALCEFHYFVIAC